MRDAPFLQENPQLLHKPCTQTSRFDLHLGNDNMNNSQAGGAGDPSANTSFPQGRSDPKPAQPTSPQEKEHFTGNL